MSYSEFVSAREVLHGKNPHVLRALTYLPEERPVVMQVFDSDEDRLVAAAARLEKYNPDIIDINMGCSVQRVAMKGAGAGLLRDPDKIGRIMSQVTAAVRHPGHCEDPAGLGLEEPELPGSRCMHFRKTGLR